MFKVKSPDEVFDTLERLLWDHANKVRYEIEKVCIIFAVCDLVLKLANLIDWLH